MPVKPGTRLGPYEITSALGAGGMGEVYRAKDTRLDRSVAIKILPAEFAADAQLRLRLEREARTISALNHPNICTLYDVGHDNGCDYLVMELIEGETLADRLARGPLPTAEVLTCGIQIAEALDRAHKQGIIHRDLKPGNVMLTRTGAKLLDFGLAKSDYVISTAADSFSEPTKQKPLTDKGTIVGTFQYMSPEQLEGAELDARSDIFAFGAVLYEMATARRAFDAKTKTSLIAAIVSGQPAPISSLQPLTPPALEHVIERCLCKDPADRWQSARDIAEELKWIQAKGSQAGIAAPIAARRRTRERLSWSLYPLLIIAAAAATWGVIELRKEPLRVVETAIPPPDKGEFAFAICGPPAISPDGKFVVFAAETDGVKRLWLRALSSSASRPLAETEDAILPFWSPDSHSVGFFNGGKLRKIDIDGGPAQVLCDAKAGRGGTWSKDGVIVFSPSLDGALFKVSDTGGESVQITTVDPKRESDHRFPWFLPDGHHFLFLAEGATIAGGGSDSIYVGSLDDKTKKKLLAVSSNAAYAPSGQIVYWRNGTLFAQSFDLKTLTLGREIVPLAENVGHSSKNDAYFSISNRGDLVCETGASGSKSQLTWFDATGKALGTVGPIAFSHAPAISHDGRRVAITVVDPGTYRQDIWIYDLARGTETRLTFGADDEYSPVWSPDDSQIVFTASATSPGDLHLKHSSGTGTEDVLYANPMWKIAYDWAPDGSAIAFHEQNTANKTSWDLWIYSFADHKPHVLLQTPFGELQPKFSPDGRWISYSSNESGRSEVYVLPASGNGKWQISTNGGHHATWSHDGKKLFYLSNDNQMVAVDVSANAGEFIAGVPRVLFMTKAVRLTGRQYDVAPDGRFLINSEIEQNEIPPLTLIQNWPAKLKRKSG